MIDHLKSKLTGTQITIGIAAAFLICLITGLILFQSVDRFRFTGPGYFPVDSMQYEIKKGDTAKLESGEDYATLTFDSGETCSGKENAVYYTDKVSAVLLSPWELVAAGNGDALETCRLNCFSVLEQNGRNSVVTAGEKNGIVNGLLLFNGQDTYIVLQKARLTVQDLEVELSPYSYVIVNRGNYVQYRDRDTNAYGFREIDSTEEVGIWLEDRQVYVYAESDRMEHDGYEEMLISELSFLNEFGAQ